MRKGPFFLLEALSAGAGKSKEKKHSQSELSGRPTGEEIGTIMQMKLKMRDLLMAFFLYL